MSEVDGATQNNLSAERDLIYWVGCQGKSSLLSFKYSEATLCFNMSLEAKTA